MAFNQSRNETELDPDHPMSNAWPEVFENGREIFSEEFYQRFPWARHIDPFKEARRRSSRDIVSSDHHGLSLDSKAEAPPVLAFVNSLISLELDDLSDDEQQCPICREVYREGQYEEMPLVLPCKHVVGKDVSINPQFYPLLWRLANLLYYSAFLPGSQAYLVLMMRIRIILAQFAAQSS